MITKIRSVDVILGEELIGKGHKEAFQNNRTISLFDRSLSYMSLCVKI